MQLGVSLRRQDGSYVSEPLGLKASVLQAAQRLGAAAVLTMSSEIVSALLEQDMMLTVKEIELNSSGTLLPIARSVQDIGTERSTAIITICVAV